MINNDIIFNTIDNGIILLNKDLEVLAWNHWLEVRTGISENTIIKKQLCVQFPYINVSRLKRKIKAALVTRNPSYYNVDPHKFLIDIKTNSVVDSTFESMQQDITIVPYDVEKNQVCLYIYDKTSLCKINHKLELLNDKLKDLSNRDPLTHAFNRRYFNEFSEKMLSLSKRNDHPFCLLMVDVDRFKSINDNYGHTIGDDVIILLANKLEGYVRSSDIVSRFGGEEFSVLLYNANIDDAKNVAEKIRKCICELELDTPKGKLTFTVSIGVSQYHHIEDSNSIENTLRRADNALYAAKDNGRNQVVITD